LAPLTIAYINVIDVAMTSLKNMMVKGIFTALPETVQTNNKNWSFILGKSILSLHYKDNILM